MPIILAEPPVTGKIIMDLTADPANKRLILSFDDAGWSVVKHLNKVFGSTFIKNFFEKFFNDRSNQRQSVRGEVLSTAFKNANTDTKNQVLTILGVDFNDE